MQAARLAHDAARAAPARAAGVLATTVCNDYVPQGATRPLADVLGRVRTEHWPTPSTDA